MGKLTKRLVWLLLAFVVGLAGNLIAAWIQNDVLQNLFTPRRLGVTGLLVFLVLILMAWKELQDEAARPDDKRDLTREQRNRAAMLAKVRSFWVTGVLEQSLHGAALIELGKEYKPDAVYYPWSSVLQRPDQPDKSLLSGTKTVEVFDAVGGELLILGAPGSGKTTMLLDLARDLIARAERDDKLPIPVVFNLSSWAEKRPPLADWLAEELNFRYDVPKKIATAWVKDDSMLPLLDGLDEVKLEHRAACVEAINSFRQDHGLLPTVVCSRIKEYETLNAQLRLQGAIVLQPLTPEQIDDYLKHAGEQLASVRVMLRRDAALRELAESPLMLSIIALAYSGLPMIELAVLYTVEKRRNHLFDTYVKRMFKRPNRSERQWHKRTLASIFRRWLKPNSQLDEELFYTPEQTIHWLSWLARRLVEHGQTTFYLERMQPSWLLSRSQRRNYPAAIGLVGGSVGVLVGGILGGLVGVLVGGLVGVLVGVVVGLLMVALQEESTVYPLSAVERAFLSPLARIRTVETLRWSWSEARDGLLLFGPLGILAWPVLVLGLGLGLFLGLLIGLVSGLFGGLLLGLKAGEEIETKIMPNQGIWRSAQNAVLVGLIVMLVIGLVGVGIGVLVIGLVGGPVNGVVDMMVDGLVSVLRLGLAFGIFSVLIYGGSSCVLHATLRLFLYRGGALPLNYVRFLDYCAERIFLRKVGGGYIFVHRLLMEYFAGLGD